MYLVARAALAVYIQSDTVSQVIPITHQNRGMFLQVYKAVSDQECACNEENISINNTTAYLMAFSKPMTSALAHGLKLH